MCIAALLRSIKSSDFTAQKNAFFLFLFILLGSVSVSITNREVQHACRNILTITAWSFLFLVLLPFENGGVMRRRRGFSLDSFVLFETKTRDFSEEKTKSRARCGLTVFATDSSSRSTCSCLPLGARLHFIRDLVLSKLEEGILFSSPNTSFHVILCRSNAYGSALLSKWTKSHEEKINCFASSVLASFSTSNIFSHRGTLVPTYTLYLCGFCFASFFFLSRNLVNARKKNQKKIISHHFCFHAPLSFSHDDIT